MKIKQRALSYEKVCALPRKRIGKPMRPSRILHTVIRILSAFHLWQTHFRFQKHGMEQLGKKEPCLILMNHSCFLDMEIASACLYPRPFHIVTTTDAFVGKNLLMRLIGCIPTVKFVADLSLIQNMQYALKKQNGAVLMYPEAGYSFDGTAVVLPSSLGKCIKLLGVSVVMIRTYGAFLKTPLYNELRNRRVDVSADVTYLLSPEDIRQKTAEELQQIVEAQFDFDHFAWQRDHGVVIDDPHRADGLNRLLYQCPHCMSEGHMRAEGTTLTCTACGKYYTLTENGQMEAFDGNTEFPHIPDWYAWERSLVRQAILDGTYSLDVPVEIHMLVNTDALYRVGDGVLHHDRDGFHLTGCDGALDYRQKPLSSYSLNADYYWYEIGDVISIGDVNGLYYCFPKGDGDIVAKTRLATEELYSILMQEKEQKRKERSRASETSAAAPTEE